EEGQTILLITNDVDEALYMADRIIPLSVGPAASLGAETEVDLPRPRDRRQIATDTSILKLRNQVINFLLAEKEKEKGRGEGRAVSLPNIRPMDITRAKPTTYIGHRPKAKKELTES
ncbi:MAG: ABC transporter ATP-binding protein, partial [Verrucomicrobiota bacterium]